MASFQAGFRFLVTEVSSASCLSLHRLIHPSQKKKVFLSHSSHTISSFDHHWTNLSQVPISQPIMGTRRMGKTDWPNPSHMPTPGAVGGVGGKATKQWSALSKPQGHVEWGTWLPQVNGAAGTQTRVMDSGGTETSNIYCRRERTYLRRGPLRDQP